jgi:hypothetical protein
MRRIGQPLRPRSISGSQKSHCRVDWISNLRGVFRPRKLLSSLSPRLTTSRRHPVTCPFVVSLGKLTKERFRAHEPCCMCRPAYILIHAYRIRQFLSCLTHCHFQTSKPLTLITAVQWWAQLQLTDAVRLIRSLAKDASSARGVTTRFVFHGRFLRVVARPRLDSSSGRAAVLPRRHAHTIPSATRPSQYAPGARNRA